MHKIMLYKDGKSNDITALVGDLTWNESIDTVGARVSLTVPDNEERYIPRLMIEAGDIISIFNENGEMLRTVVVKIEREYPKRKITAYDFGFYINKNDVVIQFKGESVSQCLKNLFGRVGIGVGAIADMPAKVTGVYIENVNEVIKALIKLQQDNDGKQYGYEMRGANIFVFQLPTEPIPYIFKPAENVGRYDVTVKGAHGRGKYSHSIESTRNRVHAIVNSKVSGNMPAMELVVSDSESIKKYGLLSENYTVDAEEASNIEAIAKNELKEKSKLQRTLAMTFVGHDDARAGRVMYIADEYLNINDYFRIKSVSHRVTGNIHLMDCSLEYLKEAEIKNITESKLVVNAEVEASSLSAETKGLIEIAESLVGKPYVWGAVGPDSFDCSGFVYYCYNKAGIKTQRHTAQGFYNSCTPIKHKDAKPGDLVFWQRNGGGIYHVAIYTGNDKYIAAENEKIGVAKGKVTKGLLFGRLS